MDLHIGALVLIGIALLAMTVLPRVLHSRPLTVPIVYVAAGFVVFWLIDSVRGPRPLTEDVDAAVIEYVTEFVVIISLAGTGLRLESHARLTRWRSSFRLLLIAMPLSIAAVALAGSWLAGLAVAPALLLGAVLAPTDPVLADTVQVGPPGDDEQRDEVRFTLTAEAGMNDGLAFPFVHLAIAATTASLASSVPGWLGSDVAYRVVVGLAAGWAMGRVLTAFGRRTGEFFRSDTSEGGFAIGATLLVYGATEIVNGYGFLAVFVAALVSGGESERYRRKAHDFAEQIEAMTVALTLIAFGAMLSEGILDALTWSGAAIAVSLLLVVRPLVGWLALVGRPLPAAEKLGIAFFGIRGLGSIYYLAYAANHGEFAQGDLAAVWSIVSLTILISIALHGLSSTPLLRMLDRRRSHDDADHEVV